MKISELMKADVETCFPDDNLAAAAGKMWKFDIGCIPVIGPNGQVVGMITDRDICMAAYIQGRPLNDIFVYTVMSREVFSCKPDETLSEAEETMRAHQLRRLPVLDRGSKLVGIVSLNDLVREAERETGSKNHEVNAREVTGLLAAVCQPRSSGLARWEDRIVKTVYPQ